MVSRENFLKPETRCDTYISAERKAAWKVMLDMLEELIRVCKKYDLKYHLDGGSLLGAIRHQGIIPWDDDIDVAMFRDDYDKLQEVLPKELPPHLFMQTSLTDPEYPIGHVKIRDSRTTGVGVFYAKRKMRFNMGIFLDIFPIDGIPDGEDEKIVHLRKLDSILHVRRNLFWHKFGGVLDVLKCIYARVICFVYGGSRRLFERQEAFCRKYDYHQTREAATCISLWGFKKNNRRRMEWFRSYREVPFEYLTVSVPEKAEDILTNIYGDWHEFVKGTSVHSEVVLDASVDYKTYLKDRFGYDDSCWR